MERWAIHYVTKSGAHMTRYCTRDQASSILGGLEGQATVKDERGHVVGRREWSEDGHWTWWVEGEGQ